MRRIIPTIAVATAFFGLMPELRAELKSDDPAQAATQTASDAEPAKSPGDSDALSEEGPFRLLSEDTRTSAFMISGPLSVAIPDAPIERWMWVFLKKAKEEAGIRHDTVAVRSRIDCSASSAQVLKRELFLNGVFQKTISKSGPPIQGKEGTIGYSLVQSVCDVDYGKNLRSVSNFSAARDVAAQIFSGEFKTTRAAEKPMSPLPGTVRERHPIRLTDSGFAENTLTVTMTEGAAPKQKPDGVVEIWEWSFIARPLTMAGKEVFLSRASLKRVDCDKKTSQELEVETYADDKLLSSKKPSTGQGEVKPALTRLVRSACDPTYKPDAPTFANFREAQVVAMKIIAERKQKTAAQEDDVSKSGPDKKAQPIPPDLEAAASGEAERVGVPLRLVAMNRATQSFHMAANAAPKNRPVHPTEIWVWEFTQKARRLDGQPSYDTWATRMRVDCRAVTVRPQLREAYRDGRFDKSWELMGKARKAARGSLEDAVMRAACEPDYRVAGQRFADHHVARRAALKTAIKPGSK